MGYPSEKMLTEVKEKLPGNDIRYFYISSQQLMFESEFDVVTAVQSHYYLQPDESDSIALSRWVRFLNDHGNSPENALMQFDHRETDKTN